MTRSFAKNTICAILLGLTLGTVGAIPAYCRNVGAGADKSSIVDNNLRVFFTKFNSIDAQFVKKYKKYTENNKKIKDLFWKYVQSRSRFNASALRDELLKKKDSYSIILGDDIEKAIAYVSQILDGSTPNLPAGVNQFGGNFTYADEGHFELLLRNIIPLLEEMKPVKEQMKGLIKEAIQKNFSIDPATVVKIFEEEQRTVGRSDFAKELLDIAINSINEQVGNDDPLSFDYGDSTSTKSNGTTSAKTVAPHLSNLGFLEAEGRKLVASYCEAYGDIQRVIDSIEPKTVNLENSAWARYWKLMLGQAMIEKNSLPKCWSTTAIEEVSEDELSDRAGGSDVQAQILLASLHERGIIVEEDSERALELLNKASEAGDGEAIYLLAKHYIIGGERGISADKLRDMLTIAAKNGEARAYYLLGVGYEEGQILRSDIKMAVRNYELATSAGCLEADYRLGMVYKRGLGIPKDLKKAASHLQKAADAGNGEACRELSGMYSAGIGGLKRDAKLAQHYLEQYQIMSDVNSSRGNITIPSTIEKMLDKIQHFANRYAQSINKK